jgi:hypothetical protein
MEEEDSYLRLEVEEAGAERGSLAYCKLKSGVRTTYLAKERPEPHTFYFTGP